MNGFDVSLFVHSDKPKDLGPNVQVIVGTPTKDPRSLPFAHKKLFVQNVDKFDLFLYNEDDILITQRNLEAFLALTEYLEPHETPGFFRYELDSIGARFYPDAHHFFHWEVDSVGRRGPYTIAQYSNLHSGCYLLTQRQLGECLKSGSYLHYLHNPGAMHQQAGKHRQSPYKMLESAATDPFTLCGARKVLAISHWEDCLVHHLPNKYVGQGGGLDEKSMQEQIQTLGAIQNGCILPNIGPASEHPHWKHRQIEDQARFNRAYRFIMRPPKVSIGLPVYNGERYLAEAIRSILEQSYDRFELVISDNASTDNTQEICREFAAKDKRIRYYRNTENVGLARNHTRVLELARGEYFKWAAHDDTYQREFLARCLEALKGSDAIAAYTAFNIIDETGRVIRTGVEPIAWKGRPSARLRQLIRQAGGYTVTFSLFKSDVLRQTGAIGRFPFGDHVYVAELAVLGEFAQVDQPLLNLRMHEGRSCIGKKGAALRRLHDPECKRQLLPTELFADLKIIQAIKDLPIAENEKRECIVVALSELARKRVLKWTFPIRRRIGLAPSVKRRNILAKV
jgi:glycosyltransferase involved in cell wall biosynthesis